MARHWLKRAQRLLKVAGMPIAAGETLDNYALRMEARWPELDGKARPVLGALTLFDYANKIPQENDVDNLYLLNLVIEKQMRAEKKGWAVVACWLGFYTK